MEGQSAPALPNVPLAGLALPSVGQSVASPVGAPTSQTGVLVGTPTGSPKSTGSYNINAGSNNVGTGSYKP